MHHLPVKIPVYHGRVIAVNDLILRVDIIDGSLWRARLHLE